VSTWYKSPRYEIWYDLNVPGSLGRRGAPNQAEKRHFWAHHVHQPHFFLRAEITYLINHCVFSLRLFCNDVFSLQGPIKNHYILVQRVVWCEGLHAKSRVHATAIQAWAP